MSGFAAALGIGAFGASTAVGCAKGETRNSLTLLAHLREVDCARTVILVQMATY